VNVVSSSRCKRKNKRHPFTEVGSAWSADGREFVERIILLMARLSEGGCI
jgi:hypothetical protein